MHTATRRRRPAGLNYRGHGSSKNLPTSPWTPVTPPSGPTVLDMLCGAGGASLGLTRAGMRLIVGMNHWQTAVDTHAANFTYAEHLCEDVTTYPLRRLPTADVLWASPICTEMSPAGGKTKVTRNKVYVDPKKPAAAGQGSVLDELGYVPAEGYEATRATHWSVVQATEIHRFKYVITENVADCAEDWELFDLWVQTVCRLRPGYRVQIISLNSALVSGDDNESAPQWRDRVYCVFTRADMPEPDLTMRPTSLCPGCGITEGVQTWSPGTMKRVAAGDGDRRLFLVGRYRRIADSSYGQYWYTCPNGCRDDKNKPQRVEPFIRPAASAIDWSDLGTTIGSRTGSDMLTENTIDRIKAGLRRFGRPVVVNSAHDDVRITDPRRAPLSGRTTKIGDGLACPPMTVPCGGTWAEDPMSVLGPHRAQLANEKGCEALVTPPVQAAQPFITVLRTNADVEPIHGPFSAVTTGNHQYVTVPPGAVLPTNVPPDAFYIMNYSAETGVAPTRMCRSVGEPLGAMTASNSHGIVVPYYTTGDCSTTTQPLGALSTHDRYAVLRDPAGFLADVDIEEWVRRCYYRMLKPRESLRAQRFPDEYIVLGGIGDQTAQAGNAVSANCSQFIGTRVTAAMARTSATY